MIFFSFGTLSKTMGHAYKLFKTQTTNTVRKNFFAESYVWNSLPSVVNFFVVSIFLTLIKVDFTEFLKCKLSWTIPESEIENLDFFLEI